MGLFSFFKSGDKRTSEGLTYQLLPDGTYAVKGLGKCKDIELVIPDNT